MTLLDDALRDHLVGMAHVIEKVHPERASQLAYSCYERLVLNQGRAYTAGPRPDWVKLGAQKNCYSNTMSLVISKGSRYRLRYVEGYYLPGDPDGFTGIPTLHAWAVNNDDEVFDPTWPHPEETAYYGLILDWHDALKFSARYGCGVLASEYLIGNPLLATGRLFPEGWSEAQVSRRRERQRRRLARH